MGGDGSSRVNNIAFNNSATGIVEAQTGVIIFDRGTSAGGNYIAALDAAINITGNGSVVWTGTFTGSGAGTILFGGGTLSTGEGTLNLNFPNGLFHWDSGRLTGSIVNQSFLTFDGTVKQLTNAVLTKMHHLPYLGTNPTKRLFH